MADQSPARPWFDHVTELAAIKGWGIAELARRAHVGRPTIYGWRDGTGTPQPGPVGDVADVLGVPRRHALVLAGIIAARPLIDPEVEADIRELAESPEEAEALLDAMRQRKMERLRTTGGAPAA
jgi:transcriptional regulator with XRE-family HTH domain